MKSKFREVLLDRDVTHTPTAEQVRQLVRRGSSVRFPLDEAVDLDDAMRFTQALRQQLPADLLVILSPSRPASIRVLQLVSDTQAAEAAPALHRLVDDFQALARRLVARLRAEVLPAYDAGEPYPDRLTLAGEAWNLHIHGEHCRFESSATGQLVEADVYRPDEIDPYFLLEYVRTSSGYSEVLSACLEGFHDMCRLLELAGITPGRQALPS